MSKPRHTLGPWAVEGLRDGDGYLMGGDSIEIVAMDQRDMVKDQIATVLVDTGEDTPSDRRRVLEKAAATRNANKKLREEKARLAALAQAEKVTP